MDVSLILRLAQMCCPFYNSTVFHAECLVFLSLVCMEYVNTHTHTHTHTHPSIHSYFVSRTLYFSPCVSPAQKRDQNLNFTSPIPLPPNTHTISSFKSYYTQVRFVVRVANFPLS